MPKDTFAANAASMPAETAISNSGNLEDRLKWEAAYSGWLAAKADTFAPVADDSDEARTAVYNRLTAAKLNLIATPAPLTWAILQKLQFVEEMFADDFEVGEPAYPLALLALASVRTDFMALRLKDAAA